MKRESDGPTSSWRGRSNHCRVRAPLSIAMCVAILVLSAASPCMGREDDHLGDESSLPMSRVVESALAISAKTLQDSGTHLEGLPPSQSVAPAIVSVIQNRFGVAVAIVGVHGIDSGLERLQRDTYYNGWNSG